MLIFTNVHLACALGDVANTECSLLFRVKLQLHVRASMVQNKFGLTDTCICVDSDLKFHFEQDGAFGISNISSDVSKSLRSLLI